MHGADHWVTRVRRVRRFGRMHDLALTGACHHLAGGTRCLYSVRYLVHCGVRGCRCGATVENMRTVRASLEHIVYVLRIRNDASAVEYLGLRAAWRRRWRRRMVVLGQHHMLLGVQLVRRPRYCWVLLVALNGRLLGLHWLIC